MKRIHYLLLGLLVSLTIAAVSPSSPPTRIIAGSGVTVVTNSAASFTISASGGVGTSNGFATNLSVYSSGTTNRSFRAFGTNNSTEVYVDKDGILNAGAQLNVAGNIVGTLGASFNGISGVAAGRYALNSGSAALVETSYPGPLAGLSLGSAAMVGWTSNNWQTVADTVLSRSAAGVLEVNNGTAGTYRDLRLRTLLAYAQPSDPASSATFGQVYAKTNGATTEVYVMDGAGNVTQISPHARASSPAPASVDAGDKTPIVIHHKNLFTGEQEWLHLSAMARKLEQLTGEKFVWKRRIPDAEVRDWDAEQARIEAESDDDVKADRKRLREWERDNSNEKGPAPTVREKYRRAPKPDFLKN